MPPLPQLCRTGLRLGLSCILGFLLWSLWLLLASTLVFQLLIAVSGEISLPSPLLRLAEKQLSPAGFSLKLGSVRFDPSGELVVRDFSLVLNSLDEPVATGRILHTRIDPWGLLVGSPDARRLSLSGVNILLPTAFSPSGRAEACIRDLHAELLYERKELSIEELTARTQFLALVVRGGVRLEPFAKDKGKKADPEQSVRKLLNGLRKLVELYPRLEAITGARAELRLTPSDSRGAVADLDLAIDNIALPAPVGGNVGPLRLSTRLPLAGASPAMVTVQLGIGELSTPKVLSSGLSARVRGILRPADFTGEIREVDLAAAQVSAAGVTAVAPFVHLEPLALPRVRFTATTQVEDAVLELEGEGDLRERSAKARIRTSAGDGVVRLAGSFAKRDLSKYVSFTTPARLSCEAELLPGGRPGLVEGWVEADNMVIYRVPVDHVQGRIRWDGTWLLAHEAMLRVGQNFARGSYDMNAKTRDFRFLLDGGLRPVEIGAWFKEWWPELWSHFDFTKALPLASVDVKGRWKDPASVTVYVGADATDAVIKNVFFSRAWTQVWVVRQSTFVPYLHGVRPEGEAKGWFNRLHNPEEHAWERVAFDVAGRMMPTEVVRILDPQGSEIAAPFWFSEAAEVHARGRVEGPAGTRSPRQDLWVDLKAKGPFKFHGFPVSSPSASAHWVDGVLDLRNIEADYAQGTVRGTAHVDTNPELKSIEFDAKLDGAKLSEAVAVAEQFIAFRMGKPLPDKGTGEDKFGGSKIQLNLKAKGRYDDLMSYKGTGDAAISGAELGQVRMFGLLSELLRFTTLRFTGATTTFSVEGSKIVFPTFQVAGRNSAIEAHGSYSLETKNLDFNAKVWPFEKSQGLVQEAMKLVLFPLSHVLEVKLTGTLGDPKWSFSNNPFRSRLEEPIPPSQAAAVPPTTMDTGSEGSAKESPDGK